jgi:inhibitor of KinA
MNDFAIVPMGDSCLTVTFEAHIDPLVNARCIAVARAFEQAGMPGVHDVVPAYHTVAVHFDPGMVDRPVLQEDLGRLAASATAVDVREPRVVEIPVQYGGDEGPDLASVAGFAGCTEQDVVRLHTASTYQVYMLGFLPGFAYLGPVDPKIAMPRLQNPRLKVPRGSVGIAGAQTGIYPCETPGGWRIVGRTEMPLFDPGAARPSALRAGDRVRFVAA